MTGPRHAGHADLLRGAAAPTRRLDCLISRIASGPRRSVRAGPGRRRIFIRTDLVPAPSTAASCVTGTPGPAAGYGSGSLLVQWAGLPRLFTREAIAQVCGILGGRRELAQRQDRPASQTIIDRLRSLTVTRPLESSI